MAAALLTIGTVIIYGIAVRVLHREIEERGRLRWRIAQASAG